LNSLFDSFASIFIESILCSNCGCLVRKPFNGSLPLFFAMLALVDDLRLLEIPHCHLAVERFEARCGQRTSLCLGFHYLLVFQLLLGSILERLHLQPLRELLAHLHHKVRLPFQSIDHSPCVERCS
jgi:hypothetical protein